MSVHVGLQVRLTEDLAYLFVVKGREAAGMMN